MRYVELTEKISGDHPITNSLGQSIAYSKESLQRFWEWFGKSKVVDKEGRPLVVYHGRKTDFRSFDPERSKFGGPINYHPSFFFTSSPDVAQSYAAQTTHTVRIPPGRHYDEFVRLATSKEPGDSEKALDLIKKHGQNNLKTWGDGANVMPVYLRMIKPLRATARGWSWNTIFYDGDVYSTRDLIEIAISKGCDGIIIRNVHDRGEGQGKPSTIYAVISSNQIKSAIGNSGSFSTDSDMVDENRSLFQ